jgi:hypothetical protein
VRTRQAADEIIGNPARLLHPRPRALATTPSTRRSWDEALDLVARAHADVGRRAGRHLDGRTGWLATNYGTRLSGAPRTALRQPVGLPVVERHDDLLGARRYGLGSPES